MLTSFNLIGFIPLIVFVAVIIFGLRKLVLSLRNK